MYKIFSYVLLGIGILFVLFALHGMYQAFSAGQPVPELVQLTDWQLQTKAGPVTVSASSVNTLVNMGVFAVLMFFVMTSGAKIAGLGIQLLKNERIYDALLQKNSSSEALKKL